MQTNETPFYDASINTTGCCPKFNPAGWDRQELHFRNKPFIRATTKSIGHIPINMGKVFGRVQKHIDDTHASDTSHQLVMSHDTSAFGAEHLFAVTKGVPDEEMTTLSGDYITKVFEGPYKNTKRWHEDMRSLAKSHGAGDQPVWFFYTTCPKCAKAYGKNYVVGIAEV
jgi:hypothetical protein